MSLAKIVVDIEKGLEIGAEEFAKVFTRVSTAEPRAIAALGVLAAAVEKALTDCAGGVATAETNPATLVLTVPVALKDFEALWPDLKTFLGTLGIKAGAA